MGFISAFHSVTVYLVRGNYKYQTSIIWGMQQAPTQGIANRVEKWSIVSLVED